MTRQENVELIKMEYLRRRKRKEHKRKKNYGTELFGYLPFNLIETSDLTLVDLITSEAQTLYFLILLVFLF